MILRTENLSKSFGPRKAVSGLSLEVPEGSVYGFLGPNGSGKSTTIRMMTALIKPDSGTVFINGKSVQLNGHKALMGVGALIERADFYKHLSAKTNLEMLARMDGISFDRVTDVLERVGLQDRALDKVKNYSQGMKQRLGIAQALLGQPKLLILDEPTNGLDPQGMKEIRELIQELNGEGITIFLSSHLLDEIQKVCSHVAMVSFGKMVVEGNLEELLRESDLFTTEIRVQPLDKAEAILKKQDWIHRCDQKDGALWVRVSSSKKTELVNILVENQLKVEAVIPRTSLEDLFLSKTGIKSRI